MIERSGMLGGVWTNGLLSWMLDCSEKKRILCEIIKELEESGHGRFARNRNFLAEPEFTHVKFCKAFSFIFLQNY